MSVAKIIEFVKKENASKTIRRPKREAKIKAMLEKLLKHYISMEKESDQPMKYYYHYEHDYNNLGGFEDHSNKEQICLVTNLGPKFASHIMIIFQVLFDADVGVFDAAGYVQEYVSDVDAFYKDQNVETWDHMLENIRCAGLIINGNDQTQCDKRNMVMADEIVFSVAFTIEDILKLL